MFSLLSSKNNIWTYMLLTFHLLEHYNYSIVIQSKQINLFLNF